MERDQFLASMVRNRRGAAERAVQARIKGYAMVADTFERLVTGWDRLLARNGVKPDA